MNRLIEVPRDMLIRNGLTNPVLQTGIDKHALEAAIVAELDAQFPNNAPIVLEMEAIATIAKRP